MDNRRVMASVDHLDPFFLDRCWLFVLLAREAPVGVIFRRGPSKWWRVTRWDTSRDVFEGGQWFRGHLYPDRCDLSPDGKLLLYFAGKFRPSAAVKGYHGTWTAVSRPPYLTALALWPIGDTWGGGGVFLDNRTVVIATSAPSFGPKHHPDHPTGPLQVLEYRALKRGDPRRDAQSSWLSGWDGIPAPKQLKGRPTIHAAWRKRSGTFILEREAKRDPLWGGVAYEPLTPPSHRRSLYTLFQADGEIVAMFEAHWADWDQRGRLVVAVGGRVLEGQLQPGGGLCWRQLTALHDEQPSSMGAPGWAQRW